MLLPDISIRRPVLATVMSLMLVLIGIISYERLSVREYPKIDTPVVSVRTVFTGASAEIIESQITKPIEEALAGIEGIRTIKSVSREEVSQVTVEFVLERDQDAAANDVRDRVARVRGRLPDEADDPVVAKVDADAQAVIWIAFSSDRHNAMEITDYADRYIVDRLQTLPGVASVIIGGERRYAMRIWLDRDKLAALTAELGLEDRVDFLGFVSDEQVVEEYAGAMGMVLTPHDEDYGFTTLEAFFAGKPVVTCADAGGVLEFCRDGETGFVVEPDPGQIAERIDLLWEDRALCERLGHRGLEEVREKASWPRAVAALTATLE